MPITMQCNPTEPGAVLARAATSKEPAVYVKHTHHGLVLKTYERNGYDDSDWYAIVWNPAKECLDHICYATTRGWSYCNGAEIDATPEILAAARSWQKAQDERREAELSTLRAQIPEKGSPVRVRVSRGKNARFNNTTGRIFWIGSGYAAGTIRAGIEINGEKVFLDARNIWAENNGEPAPMRWDEALTRFKDTARVFSMYASSDF
jgi:hypothetical protein